MTKELMSLDGYTPEQLEELSRQVVIKRISTLEEDVKYLKDEQPVHPSILQKLENRRKRVVIDCLGGKGSQAYSKLNRVVFSEAGRDFKENFGIPKYDLLAKKDTEAAFDYWEEWQPSTNTKMKIKAMNNQVELIQA